MNTYKRNVRVLVIDRGWLEDQSIYEEQFISFIKVELEDFRRKINKKKIPININCEVISIMRDITNSEAFMFIDDEEKLKQLKYDYYKKLDEEFKDYTARYSSDRIKHQSGRNIFDKLNVFIVYTESEKELEILSKRYLVKAILKFDQAPLKEEKDNFKRIYINSIKETLKVVKEMPLFLFHDIKELQLYFIN